MPRLTIDGITVEVPQGTLVIDAAERAGIYIPRFCYHPALGEVGACRVCAVYFEDGPVKGLRMSCMTPAADGMVVSTIHPEARQFRRYVIEWLMINHPHDCPVCDEGGHCLLQDLTVSGGHGLRRYEGTKRTYRNQDLGPLVQHEMNRCIHCYCCARTYKDYCGYRDFGPQQIADKVYFGRFKSGTLESPFSGNVIDVCPTGVLTDKTARFKARRWDAQRVDTVCVHCSLGCGVTVEARNRAVVRVEGRPCPEVNGHFICDRGRFGHFYADLPQRPRLARVDGAETGTGQALDAAAERLARAGGAVACLGGTRSSLEAMATLRNLAERAGWSGPGFFERAGAGQAARGAVRGLGGLAVSQAEMAGADLVLVAGADPLGEAPMLAVAVRQAARRGARVVVVDPRPVDLPCDFLHLPVPMDDVARCLGALVRRAAGDAAPEGWAREFFAALPESMPRAAGTKLPAEAVELLAGARRPVLVCGTDAAPPDLPGFAADCARFLGALGKEPGFFPVLPGANAFGAALLDAAPGRGLDELVEDIEEGRVRALVVAEADPLGRSEDPARLGRALDALELLVVLDCLPSATVGRAHIFLPACTAHEQDGRWLNQEGRLQFAPRVHPPGMPVAQTNAGSHPPREFAERAPGTGPLPARELLDGLALRLGHADAENPGPTWREALLAAPPLAGLAPTDLPAPGARLPLPGGPDPAPPGPFSSAGKRDAGTVRVLLTDHVLGGEELAGYSEALGRAMAPPEVFLEAGLAAEAGLTDGEEIILPFEAGPVRAVLRARAAMDPALVVLPRRSDNHWQRSGGSGAVLALDRIWPEHSGPGEDG